MSAPRRLLRACTPPLYCLLVTAASSSSAASSRSVEPPEHPQSEHSSHSSRLPDHPIPLAELPARPKPIIELGEPFLGTGTLRRGFTLPTGATWQPALLLWGSLRTAFHATELRDDVVSSQWANRLDLFAQLSLTATERLVVSMRPLDQDGAFSGYVFRPDQAEGSVNQWNADIHSLYFEGDFGEIFPNLDKRDFHALDFGFAVGRMPVLFQDGLLINDSFDAVGLVRNSLTPFGWSNLRLTGMYGWGSIDRGGTNTEDRSARLYGLFMEADVPWSTIDIDLAHIDADSGDGAYAGVSFSQRIRGTLNSAFRLLGSYAPDGETAAVADGGLAFVELSWTPTRTHDLVYLNLFGTAGRFTPAARAAGAGGSLSRTGLLFSGAALGDFGNPLNNRATNDAIGGAIGWQRFYNHTRTQLIFEFAGRDETSSGGTTAVALGVRFQQAVGRRILFQLDGFATGEENENIRVGGRSELLIKF